MSKDWSWEDVEHLINDLKSDGYEPADLETSNSWAAPLKTVFIDVERSVDTDTDRTDGGERCTDDAPEAGAEAFNGGEN